MSVDFNASFSGSAETFGARMTETPASMTASMKETGGGSASNYEALRNKPKINGHELIGDIDVSEFVTMWVTFRTQQLATYAPPKQVEVTKHLGDEGVDATDKVVTVSLTQADTLLLGSLSPDEDQQVEVQIRGRTEDGRAFASNIMTAPLSRILKDGVI